jgi:glycosyltransferase involved in cell wall biosynthesis
MKLCLTVNSSPWSRFKGGGQIAVHHLATALARRGHEVHVLYSKSRGESFPCPETLYRIHWVRHFGVATFNFNIFSFAWALWRLVRRERFDIVHGNAEEALFNACICRSAGTTAFFTSHAPFIPPTGFLLAALKHPIFLLKNLNFYLLRAAARCARQIVTFSRFSRDLVLRGLGADWDPRVAVIAPGVDISWLRLVRGPKIERHLLFWGRLEDEKGIPELLQAFREVAQKEPQTRLTLVGEGGRLEAYRRMVRDLQLEGRVDFPGWLDTAGTQNLVMRAALGVFPSRIESFGLAVAEALAAGLPVVATRAGALPEIVQHEVNGTLVDVGDVPALTRALLTVLRDPERYEAQARAGREAARQKYSWDATAQNLLRLYEETARRGASENRSARGQ